VAVSSEVEIGPPGIEANHDGEQPDAEGERADRLAGQPGDDTGDGFAEHGPNRSVSASVTVSAAACAGVAVRITAANPAR
jgi:hypothetical protein